MRDDQCVLYGAAAFTFTLWGQRWVEPSRAVILEFEPVVAGLVAFAVGERLGAAGYAGALKVIFNGIVIAESRSWRKSRRRP